MKTIRIILASACISAAAIKAAPALAEPSRSEMAVTLVGTADLDLSTAIGRRILDRRLSRAARDVCGSASQVDLEGSNIERKCRDSVLARARLTRDALLANATANANANRGSVIRIAAIHEAQAEGK